MKKLALLLAGLLVIAVPALVSAQGYDVMPEDARILPIGVAGTPYADLELGKQGGTIYISQISNPKSWNANTAHETSTTWYTSRMNLGLVNLDHITGAIVPDLAKSWEVSEDSLTLTFHLRRGIKWSDGTPLTADDVLFSYNDVVLNTDVDCNSYDGQRLPDGTFPVMTKVDDYTVEVKLSVIYRPILNSIGVPIQPKHKLADKVHKLNPDVPAGTFNETWTLDTPVSELVGNGPWVVTDYKPDISVTMKRNPYYFAYDPAGTQLPYYDEIVCLVVASMDVSLLKFRNKELDVLGIRAEDLPVLMPEAGAKGYTVFVSDLPNYGTTWFMPNQDIGLEDGTQNEKREVYRNVKYREALAHLIDKDTMIQNLLNGLGAPQWSPLSMGSPFYAGRDYYGGPVTENNAIIFEYDQAKAAALLDEIGVVDADGDGWRDLPSGAPLAIEINTNSGNTIREGACLILQDDFRSVGLNATFVGVDFNTLVDRLFASTGDIIYLGLTGGDEPNSGKNVYWSCGTLHAWRYSACDDPDEIDRRIDELLDLGVGTFDLDEAFEYYVEYQQLLAKQLGYIYTVNQTFLYAYYDYVGNADAASPTSTPSGNNGLLTELCFDKRI